MARQLNERMISRKAKKKYRTERIGCVQRVIKRRGDDRDEVSLNTTGSSSRKTQVYTRARQLTSIIIGSLPPICKCLH